MRKYSAKPIKNQTMVITGASSGIGLATALMAARQGAQVVISSRNAEDLRRIARRLNEEEGLKVYAVPADVTRFEDILHLRQQAEAKFGPIDTWINNAGISIYGPLLDIPEEEERQLFETNFWSIRHGCKVAVEALRENGGTLINIGSEVSQRSIPLQGMYAASKHAMKAYTDALRIELKKQNVAIAVCLIRPAAINSLYADHAVNHLNQGAPSLPDPCYHPDVAAKAILACAEKPRRDVYVGGPSRLYAILDIFLPALVDKLMVEKMFRQQTRGTTHFHSELNEGLTHPPASEGMVEGGHRTRVRKTSVYTAMSLYPWRALSISMMSLLLIGLALRAVAG
jgi:short-subunit dehydrogenase